VSAHWLDYAPLADEDQIRQAWVMAWRPDLLAGMGAVTPEQIAGFRDRTRAAAVEFGLGFLPEPDDQPRREP
jgi:hypothetical protein